MTGANAPISQEQTLSGGLGGLSHAKARVLSREAFHPQRPIHASNLRRYAPSALQA